MSEVTEQQLEDMEALFVQTAASMTSDRGTITLHGVSPSTLYFADRPQREVGHMLSSLFVANWAAGDNSFADNPPNAVLSFAEPGDRLSRGCGRGHPGSAPGRRRAQLQHQAPRRHRAGRHRAMCAVHRPARASFVTGLRSRDAPACASSGALRARRLATDRGSNAIRENGWLRGSSPGVDPAAADDSQHRPVHAQRDPLPREPICRSADRPGRSPPRYGLRCS